MYVYITCFFPWKKKHVVRLGEKKREKRHFVGKTVLSHEHLAKSGGKIVFSHESHIRAPGGAFPSQRLLIN